MDSVVLEEVEELEGSLVRAQVADYFENIQRGYCRE